MIKERRNDRTSATTVAPNVDVKRGRSWIVTDNSCLVVVIGGTYSVSSLAIRIAIVSKFWRFLLGPSLILYS